MLTIRSRTIEQVCFYDETVAEAIEGQGRCLAAQRLADELRQRFDTEMVPLLDHPSLIPSRLEAATTLAKRERREYDQWRSTVRVENDLHVVHIIGATPQPLICLVQSSQDAKGSIVDRVVLQDESRNLVELPVELEARDRWGRIDQSHGFLQKAAEQRVPYLYPRRGLLDRADDAVRSLSQLQQTVIQSPASAVDSEAVFEWWAPQQRSLTPTIRTREGWVITVEGPDSNEATVCPETGNTLDFPTTAVLARLNTLGDQGWEVISVTEDKTVQGSSNVAYQVRYLLANRRQ